MNKKSKAKEIKGSEKRERKAREITFVTTPCRDCEHLAECEKGKEILSHIVDTTAEFGLESFTEVSVLEEGLGSRLREREIPELWLHDFGDGNCPMKPCTGYYIVDYEDGTRQLFMMLLKEKGAEAPDMMYV